MISPNLNYKHVYRYNTRGNIFLSSQLFVGINGSQWLGSVTNMRTDFLHNKCFHSENVDAYQLFKSQNILAEINMFFDWLHDHLRHRSELLNFYLFDSEFLINLKFYKENIETLIIWGTLNCVLICHFESADWIFHVNKISENLQFENRRIYILPYVNVEYYKILVSCLMPQLSMLLLLHCNRFT